ncbi:hypothetical protein EGW08_000328 [Elysia chlorotica]|uniref:Chitin-binding type-2 domain-containing protein n=1 Tax=Elysia chlorotica TaxID=188477 RepID=A0A3S1A6N6_ELYCH|nr:hypothetical protein EGW08_000328 [Elysia chlorotica]
MHVCDWWLRNSEGDARNFFPRERCAYLLWLLITPFLFLQIRAQQLHNFPPHISDISPYNFDERFIRQPVDNDYFVNNNRPTPRIQQFITSRRKEADFIQIASSQVFPTSLISRFQYAPSPSETSKTGYRHYDVDHRSSHPENSGIVAGRYVERSQRMQDSSAVWPRRSNISRRLKQPTNQVAGHTQSTDRFTQRPQPETFSELTDTVLLQVYRARNPCFSANVEWVRDSKNCSVFFVCARKRVAAVMTCPSGEYWSNRVTNCVPSLSRWDDCVDSHQSLGSEVTQPVSSTLRPRRIRRRWRKIVTTTELPIQTTVKLEETPTEEESDSGNQRYYTRKYVGHGRFYETGGRRLNLVTKRKRGGYRVHRIRNSGSRQRDPQQAQHFPRRGDSPDWRDNSVSRREGRISHWQQTFGPGSAVTSDIGIREESPSGSERLQRVENDYTSTSMTPVTVSTPIQFPNAASGSGNHPQFRHGIFRNKRRRFKLKLGKSKIKTEKDTDWDFLHNIKRINELENDAIKRHPKVNKTWVAVVEPTAVVSTTTEAFGEEAHWWLEMSTAGQTTTSTTVSSSTVHDLQANHNNDKNILNGNAIFF